MCGVTLCHHCIHHFCKETTTKTNTTKIIVFNDGMTLILVEAFGKLTDYLAWNWRAVLKLNRYHLHSLVHWYHSLQILRMIHRLQIRCNQQLKSKNLNLRIKRHIHEKNNNQQIDYLPVLGGLDGTGLESFDSAVTDNTNDGRFVDTLAGIIIGDLQTNNSKIKWFCEHVNFSKFSFQMRYTVY